MAREDPSLAQTDFTGLLEAPDLHIGAREFVRQSAATFVGQEVCLFVTYVPGNQLLPGAIAMVAALAASGQTVVVCCAVDDLGFSIDLAGLDGAAIIVKQKNGGYDFAVWAAILAKMPELWSAKRLFFVNDSILGPLDGLDRTLERLRASNADFLALTESFEHRHHTQSYFFVLQNKAMSSAVVRTFWRQVRVEQTKLAVIKKYELGLLNHMRDVAGLEVEVLFSYDFLFPGTDWSAIKIQNPTHNLWEHLISSGFPFVKAELLFVNPLGINIAHWPPIVALRGGDVQMFKTHLAKMRETRGPSGSGGGQEKWKFLRRMIGDKAFREILEAWFVSGKPRR